MIDSVSLLAEVAKLPDSGPDWYWKPVIFPSGIVEWWETKKIKKYKGEVSDPRSGLSGEEWQRANLEVGQRQERMEARYGA